MNYIITIISILIFMYGFYFLFTQTTRLSLNDKKEGFIGMHNNCPNLLLKKDNTYYLYNTRKADIPGVNPISFNHLYEYKEFIQWMRSQGIRCPVLYLEQTYDTQGERTYRMLPDPEEPNTGLPPRMPLRKTKLYDAGHDKGSYPGYDRMNQYIGNYTPLDKMYHQEEITQQLSDNPMDINWGGPQYSRDIVASGRYKEDEVEIQVN